MILLGVDTCDSRGSVSVLRDDSVVAELAHDSPEDYSSWLIPALERILQSAGLQLSGVEAYAVANGPGSFTGLRVGLTTVKALAEVYGSRIVAVPRLEAVASLGQCRAERTAAFVDAGRGQVFGAIFRKQGEELESEGETVVTSPADFLTHVGEKCAGLSVDWVTLDPDVLPLESAWRAREITGESIQPVTQILAPQIGRIGFRKAGRGQFLRPEELVADYVRRSDAEIFWKGGAFSAGYRG